METEEGRIPIEPHLEYNAFEDMTFLGMDYSPLVKACISVWVFLMEVFSFMLSNIGENFYELAKLVYNIQYNAVKYWLLNGPPVPVFLIKGYHGMEARDICSSMKDLPSTYFLEGSGKKACDEAIHFEVTSRTTVVLTVFMTLFLVFGFRPFWNFIHFLWTYSDKMRREGYERDDFLRREIQEREDVTFARQEQLRLDEEKRQRTERSLVKRTETNHKNAVLKQIFNKLLAVLSINGIDTVTQIIEMREMLDSVYERQNENSHYRLAIEEMDWQPKRWRLKNDSPNEVIIHQLENAIREDIASRNEIEQAMEEEDDDS